MTSKAGCHKAVQLLPGSLEPLPSENGAAVKNLSGSEGPVPRGGAGVGAGVVSSGLSVQLWPVFESAQPRRQASE